MKVVDGVEMLDVREAAQVARRTPETIRRWTWTGRLRAVKDGNRLMVPKAQVLLLARVSETARAPDDPSLREWVRHVKASRNGQPGATSADLVMDDRAGR